MRSASILVALAACGDNTIPIGPPLAKSDILFLGAHDDDDFIFMEPDLAAQLQTGGSSTTIYATTAGVDGPNLNLMEAVKVAYGRTVGSANWQCGALAIGSITAQHCRLDDRISIVDLGLPDGGIPGDRPESLLHLIDGSVDHLDGWFGGSVDTDSVIALFADIYTATSPASIQTLELAGTHGRDHSSHMFVASIGLWAAARVGYTGPIQWNRGYNVGDANLPVTLTGDAFTAAHELLGYYEGCADNECTCGTSCTTLNPSHETWLARQYQNTRVTEYSGPLMLADQCLLSDLTLGDCATAPMIDLAPTGALTIDSQCITSGAADQLTLAACTNTPEQFWVLDSEGGLWNGRPPEHITDMTYDHVRCLGADRAPVCGATYEARWTLAQ